MEYYNRIKSIQDNIEKVIVDKSKVIKLLLSCMLSEGHALLEDVPGLGKTMLARSLALSIDASFRRIFYALRLFQGFYFREVLEPSTGIRKFYFNCICHYTNPYPNTMNTVSGF